MFNLEKMGKRIAVIKENKKYEKNKFIYLNPDEDEDVDSFSELKLDSGYFQLSVDTSTREILYITGASGSGKSTFALNYLQEWKKYYKNGDIYVFSALKEDETLDKCKDLKRIKIEGFEEEMIDYNDLKDSLVIFDDIDCISNKNKENKYI
jgi:chromosomal replication initiation ATPase DnaA